MKSRIGVKSGKCFFQIDQFQPRPSPKKAFTSASKNRRRFASRAIWPPKTLASATLLSTVRTNRLGRQSSASTVGVASSASAAAGRGTGAASDSASVSAILAAWMGSRKHSGGSAWGSTSEVARSARIRQAFLSSRQPSPAKCTPGPCPGWRVRMRPPSHSTTASCGGLSGVWARAWSPRGSASRRSASSRPTSWVTRAIVLAETGTPATSFITVVARSNDRVSAAARVIFKTRAGVSSRASKPSGSRRGEKRPAALPAIPLELQEVQPTVDRGDRSLDRFQLGLRPTRRAPRPPDLVVHDRGHVSLLDFAAELATEFMSPQFDHRVMRHSLDGAVESIQSDRNFGGFPEQPGKFFLKFDSLPFHGKAPDKSTRLSLVPVLADVLPQIRRVPLLTF
jgi:hypothetical protein